MLLREPGLQEWLPGHWNASAQTLLTVSPLAVCSCFWWCNGLHHVARLLRAVGKPVFILHFRPNRRQFDVSCSSSLFGVQTPGLNLWQAAGIYLLFNDHLQRRTCWLGRLGNDTSFLFPSAAQQEYLTPLFRCEVPAAGVWDCDPEIDYSNS